MNFHFSLSLAVQFIISTSTKSVSGQASREAPALLISPYRAISVSNGSTFEVSLSGVLGHATLTADAIP